MNKYDDEIDKTLNSLGGAQRAAVPPGLYDAVLHKALGGKLAYLRKVNRFTVLRAAACLALLAGLNIYTLLRAGTKQQAPQPYTSSQFAQEYFSFLDN